MNGSDGTISLNLNRDSVCMGDDCTSHKEVLTIARDAMLTQLFDVLIEYVPTMSNVVWAVSGGKNVIGFIITDAGGCARTELCGEDRTVKELGTHEIMCWYYYQGFFSYTDINGERVREFSECATLLEKVKKHLKK